MRFIFRSRLLSIACPEFDTTLYIYIAYFCRRVYSKDFIKITIGIGNKKQNKRKV